LLLSAKGNRGGGPATAVREQGAVEQLSVEEETLRKIQAKEKAAKARKRAAGRGIEGKYVYFMSDVAKYRENEPLFERVNIALLQGYVEQILRKWCLVPLNDH
jgi:hypothetical protein